MTLKVLRIGPAVALQDMGRPGFTAQGLTCGGAADRLALFEGAALLDQDPGCAVLEMAGTGGQFEAHADTTIALTGASMRSTINGKPIAWNASHALTKGALLEIGPVLDGTYGYLHISGGFDVPVVMQARGAHLSIGLGALVRKGDVLPASGDMRAGLVLPRDTRFSGGALRIMPSLQTHLFAQSTQSRLAETPFARDPRANRQGLRLNHDSAPFAPDGGLSVVSEIAVPGDVQISGTGQPFILLCESQTTAGYPRIGTILPCDVPKAAQCPAGGILRFEWVSYAAARQIEASARKTWAQLHHKTTPQLRRPEDIAELGAFNLISGATTGDEP